MNGVYEKLSTLTFGGLKRVLEREEGTRERDRRRSIRPAEGAPLTPALEGYVIQSSMGNGRNVSSILIIGPQYSYF